MTKTRSQVLHGLLLATSALVASPLIASTAAMAGGPTGGSVAVGSATITTPNANQTVINQSSKKALINWNDFSVSSGSSVIFNQPNSKSLTVNRVTGPNASAIYGELLANGSIWLINANGILFGHGSQINVGALLATTSDITDDDFRKSHNNFSKASSNANASVVNQGTITTAKGGSVVLSASHVSNEGVIQANLGKVVLGGASAFTVDMKGDNLLRYQITAPVNEAPKDGQGNPQSALVSNSGTISANGGTVLMTARAAKSVEDNVINNTGMIEATSVSSHNGEIDLDAGPDGTVNAGGTLDASGTAKNQTGGAINITGGTVNVADGAKINASGDAGGGAIQIGGGLHGKGTLANAQQTNIGNATISADAITKGNGGTVTVWADGSTSLAGSISAKGGASGGNGGSVETSGGHLSVGKSATVNTSSALGATGDWLLDPTDILIQTGGTDGIGGSNIDPNTIISALGSTNVTLEATQDIDIESALDYTSGNALSLLAQGNIFADASIQNAGTGNINLIAGWDGHTTDLAHLTDPGVFGNNPPGAEAGTIEFNNNVAVGSAGGITTVAGLDITLEGSGGYSQIGYRGPGGGDINVLATGNLTLTTGEGTGNAAQIGNGDVGGSISGNITGDISIDVGDTTTLNQIGGLVWVGNAAAPTFVESGNVTLITGSNEDSGEFGANVFADLGSTSAPGSGGDFTIGYTNRDLDIDSGGIAYNSPHDFTVMSVDDVNLSVSIQNSGSGNINVVAGWDGVTTNLSALTDPGVFGNNGHSVTIGGENANGNAAVGSAGGTTTVAGANVTVEADNGYAQLGYHGTGGGDIDVLTTGDLTLNGGDSLANFAFIGNGDFTGNNGAGSGSTNSIGNVTGSIALQVGGSLYLDGGDGDNIENVWIGNVAGAGHIESGNVTVIAQDNQDNCDGGNCDNQDVFGGMIQADLGSTASSGSGGDFTVAFTDVSGNGISHGFKYDSPHALTLAVDSDLGVFASFQNQGAGAMTLIAGWNPQAPGVTPADIVNAVNASGGASLANLFVSTPGSYGNNSASVTIGGESASGSVAVGSAGGTTTVLTDDLVVNAENGFAQVGFNGGGATGDIEVSATGDVTLLGSSNSDAQFDFAQIGHGGALSFGSNSGSVTVQAGGDVVLTGGSGKSDYAQIGHGGSTSNRNLTSSFSESGTISVTGAQVELNGGDGSNSYAQIGHGGESAGVGLSGASSTDTNSGDIFVTATDGSVVLMGGSEDEGGDYAQIGNGGLGNADGLSGGASATDSGNITVTASLGSVTLSANGADSAVGFGYAQIGNGGSSSDDTANSGNIAVSAQTVSLTGGSSDAEYSQIGNGGFRSPGDNSGTIIVSATGDITLTGGSQPDFGKAYAQIGNSGVDAAGNDSGDITVTADGDLSLIGGTGGEDAENYAQIGNGSIGNLEDSNAAGRQATGNIGLTIGGTTNIDDESVGNDAWIGNVAGPGGVESGSVMLIAGRFDGSSDVNDDTTQFVEADLAGGNFTLGITNPEADSHIQGVDYSSANTLTILTAGSLDIKGTLQNSGAGNITIVGGWDGTTLDPTEFATAGVYGNNDGSIVVGGESADGDASVGSAAGTTTILGDDVSVLAENGNAQIGYHGAGTGSINVEALNEISVISDDGQMLAQIGNGGGDVPNVSGTINVHSFGGISIAANQSEAGAVIGNMSIGGSQSGDITVEADNGLFIDAAGENSLAKIGNGTVPGGTGNASGTINVAVTGGLVLDSIDDGSIAQIGNGLTDNSSAAGDIFVSTDNLTMVSSGNSSASRIGDKTSGDANSAITVDATSCINLDSYDFANTIIGNGAGGNAAGDISVASGGAISLDAEGAFSQARIGEAGTNTGGNLTVTAANDVDVNADGDNSAALISNFSPNGTVTGDIDVTSTDGNVTLIASGAGAFAHIGLGNEASAPSVSGNITVAANGGDVNLFGEGANSHVQIGNGGPGSQQSSASGNIAITASGGVFLTATSDEADIQIGNGGDGASGNFSGTISITTPGGMQLGADDDNDVIQIGNGGANSNQNSPTGFSNTGDITILADGQIALGTGGQGDAVSIGNGGGCAGAANGACGTATGVTTNGSVQFGGDITIETPAELYLNTGDGDHVWIGNGGDFSGAGLVLNGGSLVDSGNITIATAGDPADADPSGDSELISLGVFTDGAGAAGHIGNGGLNANAGASATGGISESGALSLTVGGDSILDVVAGNNGDAGGQSWVGNGGYQSQGSASGDIAINSTGGLFEVTFADLSSVQIGNGGNGFIGDASGNILITAGDPNFAVNVIVTGNGSHAQIGNGGSNTQGNDSGSITITNAVSGISVSTTGTSDYAQIGNGGFNARGNSSGNISLSAIDGSIDITDGGGAGYIQIGNGGDSSTGSASGDISLVAGQDISISTQASTDGGSYVLVGNGGNNSNKMSATGFSDTGDISLTASDITLETENGNSDVQIGNGGDCAGVNGGNSMCGTSQSAITNGNVAFGGNISVTATDTLSLLADENINGVWIGNGGDQSGAGLVVTNGAVATSGNITVTVGTTEQAGTLVMETGDPGNSDVRIGNGGFMSDAGATADGGVTTTGDVNVAVSGGSDHGGFAELFATSSENSSGVEIGNASGGGAISGTINVDVDGELDLNTASDLDGSLIGNSTSGSATHGGNVTVIAQKTDGIGDSVRNDLPGGDFTLENLGTDPLVIDEDFSVASTHNLMVLTAGDIDIESVFQNTQASGGGGITFVAGWDRTTTNPASLANTGVYGNNGGSVFIGGADAEGNSAVGNLSGLTTIEGDNITLDAVNGFAQIGFHGTTGGDIGIVLQGELDLIGGSAFYAQIGNGTAFGSNLAGGNINIESSLAAGNVNVEGTPIAASGNADLVGDSAEIILPAATDSSGVGASGAPLQVVLNSLAISTAGSDVFISSPTQGLSIGVGSDGISLGNGALTLSANGAISQTEAIVAHEMNISTTSGDITLTNAGNSFIGPLTVSTMGPDDASIFDSMTFNIDGANVGGTLTLAADGAIHQSGAIVADALDVSTTSGAITLTNSDNSFNTAILSTTGTDDASLSDSMDLTIAGATIGGDLTLAGGGSIGQSGAIHANGLTVTTTEGAIALTNAGNSFNTATLTTAGSDNASLFDSTGLTIGGANIGGNLTLAAGGAIGQTGAIVTHDLSVASSGGEIVLTNSDNAFDTLTVGTQGGHEASLADSTNLTVAGAAVSGFLNFTLSGSSTLGQSGAIVAGALNAVTGSGAISLTNSGNSFGLLSVATGSDASVADSTGFTVGGANVGGNLTLSGGGSIGESGAIDTNALNVSTTGGDIALTNANNMVASATLMAPGDVSLYDASDLTLTSATVGGDLTLLSQHNLTFVSSVQLTSGSLLAVAGWDGTTTDPSALATGNAYGNNGGSIVIGGGSADGNVAMGSASGTTTLAADNITLDGENGHAQIGENSAGATGNIVIFAKGELALNTGEFGMLIGNGGNGVTGADGGNVTITAQSLTGDITPSIADDLPGGDFTLTLSGDDVLTTTLDADYTGAHNLTLTNGGDIDFEGSVQNAGTGNITIASTGGNVLIGGAGAGGNVAVGSAGGTTSITADNVLISGINGYAQIGYHAGGSGAIDVVANGDVSLMGGAQTGYYAQIGNGGYLTSGSNSGAITIDAEGNITLAGGAGQEAYAQIGHGGAESNSNSGGYSNTGIITINGESVTLASGTGTGAYTQIGHGGYKAGASLAGVATNSGDITINVLNAVTLTGNGADAYAQIGNGGDFVNVNAANGSSGTTSGDIIVAVAATPSTTTDPITETAGSGADSYVQIGNGGNDENTPVSGATVNFTISGDVTVSDLKLTGSNTGADGYAQIGNGDSAGTGTGNISGNTTIANNTHVTAVNGTAPGASAMVGNDTGTGTVTGTVTGLENPPTVPSTPTEVAQTNGSVASIQQTPTTPTDSTVNIISVTPEISSTPSGPSDSGQNTTPQAQTPLEKLADSDGSSSEGDQASDDLVSSVGQSLTSGGHKASVTVTRTLIPGVLTQVVTVGPRSPHGIPPADEDYSSWGNEALWRW